jgi:predicted RNA-binding Zn ribbon-like protein
VSALHGDGVPSVIAPAIEIFCRDPGLERTGFIRPPVSIKTYFDGNRDTGIRIDAHYAQAMFPVSSALMATLTRPPLTDLRIVGGNLALDFVNTCAGPRHGPADTEWLSSYEDFAAWSRHAGVGHPSAAPSETAPRPAAIAAFARVQACRDDMYEIFLALGDDSAPPDPALRRLHLAYVEALAQGQLVGGTEGYAWTWNPGSGPLAPLWPIVAAAVELLTHGTADHIKPCRACRFLFIDRSKNGSRRWCSMDDCGKAAKIARYLRRRSDARGQEEPGARGQQGTA